MPLKAIRIASCLIGDGYKAVSVIAPLLSIGFTLSKAFDVPVEGLQQLSYAWALAPLVVWISIAYVRRLGSHDELQRKLDDIAEERDFAYVDMSLGMYQKTAIGPYFINRMELIFQNLGKKMLRYEIKELELEIAGIKAAIGTPINSGGVIHGGQRMQYGMDVIANNAPISTFPINVEFVFSAEYDNQPPVKKRTTRRKVRYTFKSFKPVNCTSVILEEHEA